MRINYFIVGKFNRPGDPPLVGRSNPDAKASLIGTRREEKRREEKRREEKRREEKRREEKRREEKRREETRRGGEEERRDKDKREVCGACLIV